MTGIRSTRILFGWVVAVLVLLLTSGCSTKEIDARVIPLQPPANSGTFTFVSEPAEISFPRDHGAHEEYQTEWWYYTGNLSTESGRRFGYQLTFFRRALLPAELRQERTSAWATSQVYMAHFAITDPGGRQFRPAERFSRGAVGLAGARSEPFRVWLEDWEVKEIDPGIYQLRAEQGGWQLGLTLLDSRGTVLHGTQGYSQKGPEPHNASYYYSLTRLRTSGNLKVDGEQFSVQGLSWMDHEWTSGGLAPDQIGWDWFSIQLSEGSELMLFQIRKSDGSIEPRSSGTWVDASATSRSLTLDGFEIVTLSAWRSPNSGASYPNQWSIEVPLVGLKVDLQPLLADQEMTLSTQYWEGAVIVEGMLGQQRVSGYGYVEMTGYVSPLQSIF